MTGRRTARTPVTGAVAAVTATALLTTGLAALSSTPAAAAEPTGRLLHGLTADQELVRLTTANGVVGAPVPITGAGGPVVGIDVLASTGALLGVVDGPEAADAVVVLDPVTGEATPAATLSVPLQGTSLGVDVDAAGVLRTTSDTGQLLAVDPATGVATAAGPLAYVGGTPVPSVQALASTRAGALVAVDSGTDALVSVDPTSGTLSPTGGVGFDVAAQVGLDVDPATRAAYLVFPVGLGYGLYAAQLDDAPGTALLAGLTEPVVDVAVAAPRFSITPASQSVAEAAGSVTVTVTRTDATVPGSVAFSSFDGGAVAGRDYGPGIGTLQFASGEASKDLVFPIVPDGDIEPSEAFGVLLFSPGPGTGVDRTTAVVTIVDDDVVQPTTITMQSVPVVRAPERAVVAGLLRGAAGQGLGGRTVLLVYAPADASAPARVVRTLTTQDNGLFSTQVPLTQHARFTAVFRGTAAETGTIGPTTTSRLALSAPSFSGPTTAGPGRTATFRGVVQPGASRPQVQLQWLRPDGVVSSLTSRVTVAADGSYALSRALGAGTYRLRVAALGSSRWTGSVSRVLTLRVG